ncbi:MAG: uracil-DNA glycosylase [Candidatus Cloacimonetes bacterium]|nr:uracil-DNA glycosylase [Chloroflexota bacterium]MBM4403073.1 uracil-DNA glycosylase [Candidatus Cloacimonadota bacterium]
MTYQAIKQYLELLNVSGIDCIYRATVGSADELNRLRAQYSECTNCGLSHDRYRMVYGEGNPKARAMIIGEGPGRQEDLTGRPFVGDAGQLLDRMLNAINLTRQDVYIANIVKCRPPNNRNPAIEERLACLPYLIEQINIIQPRIFLLLGLVAAQTLLQTDLPLGKLRLMEHTFMDRPAFVTYHPAALLRNPDNKKPAWEDLQRFRDKYFSLADLS